MCSRAIWERSWKTWARIFFFCCFFFNSLNRPVNGRRHPIINSFLSVIFRDVEASRWLPYNADALHGRIAENPFDGENICMADFLGCPELCFDDAQCQNRLKMTDQQVKTCCPSVFFSFFFISRGKRNEKKKKTRKMISAGHHLHKTTVRKLLCWRPFTVKHLFQLVLFPCYC